MRLLRRIWGEMIVFMWGCWWTWKCLLFLNREAADTLAEAAELISNGRWCQGSTGMTAEGDPVEWNSPLAVKWCAGGAITKMLREDFDDMARYRVMKVAMDECGLFAGQYFPMYNDARGRAAAEVIGVMRDAEARLRKRSGLAWRPRRVFRR